MADTGMDVGATRQRATSFSKAAIVEVQPTDYGFSYAGLRALPDGGYFVRGYHWVMPWYQLRGYSVDTPKPKVNGHMWVPVDDDHTMVYNFTYAYGSEPLTEDERLLVGTGNQFGVDIDVEDGFRSLRNKRNRYMIDRAVQKTRTFTGIEGTNTQDRAVQESMGAVADRTYERLGTTDRAIITARRMLLQAVKDVQAGGDPPGALQDLYRLRAIEQVIGEGESWWEAMRPGLYPEPEAMAPIIQT